MKYVVIETSGTQHLVEEGKTISVDHIQTEPGKSVTFDRVLLAVSDKTVVIGHPLVEGMSVMGTVQSNVKGKKIRVSTYKAKSRYHKTKGYRHSYTSVIIDKIIDKSSKKEE